MEREIYWKSLELNDLSGCIFATTAAERWSDQVQPAVINRLPPSQPALVEQAFQPLSHRQEAIEAPFGFFNPPPKFEYTITEINGSQDISTGHVANIGAFLR